MSYLYVIVTAVVAVIAAIVYASVLNRITSVYGNGEYHYFIDMYCNKDEEAYAELRRCMAYDLKLTEAALNHYVPLSAKSVLSVTLEQTKEVLKTVSLLLLVFGSVFAALVIM